MLRRKPRLLPHPLLMELLRRQARLAVSLSSHPLRWVLHRLLLRVVGVLLLLLRWWVLLRLDGINCMGGGAP